MPVTISLMNNLQFVSVLLKNQSLLVSNMAPGVTMGNMVLQRLLGAPFVYRFNRADFSFPVTNASTDYVTAIDDLDRIETQWLMDEEEKIYELNGEIILPKVSTSKRPTKLAPLYEDENGNITFRLDSVPDANYTVEGAYQRKAVLMTSPASTFGPVPDEFGYLYNKWMLAEGALLVNDTRATQYQSEAVAALLATQVGLSDQAKNMFLEQMLAYTRTVARMQYAVQNAATAQPRI